jgi:hypothetical protein
MDSAQSQGTEASQASAPLRDLVAHFVRYLELRLQLFGLESRETGLHLLVLVLLLVTVVTCLVGFFRDDDRFSALSNDAGFTLGVGLERPSTCRVAFGFKYWSWSNLQIQVREAAFPCHLRRVSKGS